MTSEVCGLATEPPTEVCGLATEPPTEKKTDLN